MRKRGICSLLAVCLAAWGLAAGEGTPAAPDLLVREWQGQLTAQSVPAGREQTETQTGDEPEKTPEPTAAPTAEPTKAPTAAPTAEPTKAPTAAPTAEPTKAPTAAPTAEPTAEPTAAPTAAPTDEPTEAPTAAPTADITPAPTAEETETPPASPGPTEEPEPTQAPSEEPAQPTGEPQETDEPASSDSPEPSESPAPSVPPEETETPGPSEAPDATGTPSPTEDPDATPTPDATETPAPTEEPEEEFVIDGDVLVRYNGTDKVVTLPEGIRVIGPNAFLDNENLEVVILPDSVEEIREKAFANCSHLREVILSTDSELKVIGSRAFMNCVRISRAFAEGIEQVAPDAFEGVPEETVTPSPTVTPRPTATPQPTPEEDPYEDIEWEDITVIGGGGGGGSWQPHAKSLRVMDHDYDQVKLTGIDPGGRMEVLKLGDEELDIALLQGEFSLQLLEVEGKEGSETENCLVLEAWEQPDCVWEINGASLRKLKKSGVDRLAFRTGEHTVSVPTEGFLAGWKYDEFRSRGTAGRRFTYLLEMRDSESRWWVTVENETMELDTDPLSDIYLLGVEEETAWTEKGKDLGG